MGVDDDTGKLLTASLRLETHLSVLEIIIEMRPLSSEQKAEITNIIAETKRLKERRNTVVHSNWVIDSWEKPPRTHKLTLKQSKIESFTADEINTIAIEINSLLRRSLRLHLALRGA
ncbi:MAG: hypothetical protein M3178_03510 [Pseudomonadota bacterium]|nr:hypothetical protein [Pseudomonadota bacterium]